VDKIKHCFETGEVWEDTFPLRGTDGQYRWFLSRAVPVHDEHGTVLRWCGTNTDITERKQTEEAIQQLNVELHQHTAQLEEANKELDSFSYSVAHDLRAPLRAVDGFSSILAADYANLLDDNGRRMLGVIRGETERMGRLIDDLLAFSRLGRQAIEPEPIDMQNLAQEVFDGLAAQEPERKLRLNLQAIPPATGTVAMIRQVWVNLISNAVKFTKGREVSEIEIGVREGEEDGPIYFVKDNGAGFDMRFAGKLFGIFQRLHSEHEFPGIGIGLALVQRIVERHGGRVWAEGDIERGATFFFTIPKSKTIKHPLEVLVVEDNPSDPLSPRFRSPVQSQPEKANSCQGRLSL
jgi:light-regulated signal transduction histidine kinase (bacteriophytochrome)